MGSNLEPILSSNKNAFELRNFLMNGHEDNVYFHPGENKVLLQDGVRVTICLPTPDVMRNEDINERINRRDDVLLKLARRIDELDARVTQNQIRALNRLDSLAKMVSHEIEQIRKERHENSGVWEKIEKQRAEEERINREFKEAHQRARADGFGHPGSYGSSVQPAQYAPVGNLLTPRQHEDRIPGQYVLGPSFGRGI